MFDFRLSNRSGFVVDTDKTGNTLGGADGNPRFVGNYHLNNNVTGEGLFLSFDFLTAANDHFALNGDNGLKDLVFQIHGLNTSLQIFDNFVFVARIGVDDIPSRIEAGFKIGKFK